MKTLSDMYINIRIDTLFTILIPSADMQHGCQDNEDFPATIARILAANDYEPDSLTLPSHTSSAVLVPLMKNSEGESQLLLTRRSQTVPQPGDYCFPGGHINPRLDPVTSMLLPLFPPCRSPLISKKTKNDKKLSLLTAAALREAWEEIRLNPFKVRILGALPPRELISFNKQIFPIVGWITQLGKLKTNEEVDSILHVSINDLLSKELYTSVTIKFPEGSKTTCCFHPPGAPHFIWGATMKIILNFLSLNYGFKLPEKLKASTPEYILPDRYLS